MVVTNEQLMVAVKALVAQNRSMAEQMQRIADQMEKAQCRKVYHKEYYKRRKEEASERQKVASERVQVPDGSIFLVRKGLPLVKWMKKMVQFHDANKPPENFLTWLTWSWNKDTFALPPITKSGGYHNVLIGVSGDKGLRNRHTEGDLFPRLRAPKFTKLTQMEAFRSCKWWDFGSRVLGRVYRIADDDGIFEKFRPRFQKLVRVMVGSTGECPAGAGECFDQEEPNLVKMNRTFKKVRNALDTAVAACKKGLYLKEEPFTAHFQ